MTSGTGENHIFHICTRAAADAALAAGAYRAPSLTSEGFIHLSRAHQVRSVAEAFYTGQEGLVLLVVDPRLLTAPLRYEAPAHPPVAGAAAVPHAAQTFPHLYGPLNAGAVCAVVDLARFDPSRYGSALDDGSAHAA